MNIELLRKIDRIHPYPAKFPIDLALEYIEKYSKDEGLVYDPFMGSGTTLLAASVLNRKSVGTDINYIAVLISKFKTLNMTQLEIDDLKSYIKEFELNAINNCMDVELFKYKSIDHWFCENSIRMLSYIKQTISQINSESEQIFCKLVMSSIINTVSNQESDTRYAAIIKDDLTLEKISTIYVKKFKNAIEIFEEYNGYERNDISIAELLDSNLCGEILEPNSVDLILTSPPYVNTYDYYLYHKHRMNWLGYDVQFSMEKEIGSRREYSSLKHEESKFNNDLKNIFISCDKVLKPGGVVVLVIGDGKVAGKIYDAKENMEKVCNSIGWRVIDYNFTQLDKTSRSFQQSYRTKGKKEHIIVLKKEG